MAVYGSYHPQALYGLGPYIPKLYQCLHIRPTTGQSCHVTFTQLDSLAEHEDRVHDIPGYFPCLICHDAFDRVRELDQHHRTNHANPATSRVVSDAPTPRAAAERHRRTFTCGLCSQSFASRFHLLHHQRSKHMIGRDRMYLHRDRDRSIARRAAIRHHTLHDHVPEKSPASELPVSEEDRAISPNFPRPLHAGESGSLREPKPQHAGVVTTVELRCHDCELEFIKPDDFDDHMRYYHTVCDTTSNAQWQEHGASAVSSPTRSCASLPSSCDSGISHPPRNDKEKKKKRKVPGWTLSEGELCDQVNRENHDSAQPPCISDLGRFDESIPGIDFVRQYIENIPHYMI